jgi:hypothetical protein
MANGTKRSSKNNGGFSGDASFSDLRITAQIKDDFLAWSEDYPEGLIGLLLSLADDSYRLSVKRDYNGRGFQCSLTQQDDKHRNSGIICVSRSGDIVEAIFMCGYKVFRMYPDDPLPVASQTGDWG